MLVYVILVRLPDAVYQVTYNLVCVDSGVHFYSCSGELIVCVCVSVYVCTVMNCSEIPLLLEEVFFFTKLLL